MYIRKISVCCQVWHDNKGLMVTKIDREWVNALLEPKCLNLRKTMISLLTRPCYKPNKVLSDPYYVCDCIG